MKQDQENMPPNDAIPSLAGQVIDGYRPALARAITLVESRSEKHFHQAQAILTAILHHTGRSVRLGISGVPGVGKSTFIEALGDYLTLRGHRVAVLAVDPSSRRSGGAILGDKTRMAKLSVNPNAFIRPSPSSGMLGGVARATRESILLCEAAGFDIILVETVGTGQSETEVADMVDHFLVLMLPGAGDELQGIKKGILELADCVAVNKADMDPRQAARAVRDYRAALSIISPETPHWRAPVLTCSGLTGDGLPELWSEIEKHRLVMTKQGQLDSRRRAQRVRWLWALLDARLHQRLRRNPAMKELISQTESDVEAGRLPPSLACEKLLAEILAA